LKCSATFVDWTRRRVAVSHAYGLAQADHATQDRLGRQPADAGVSLITAAVYNFPVPPITRLHAAGVTIACGHDGIRDLWSPFGERRHAGTKKGRQ
jgi:cytosine deaminase